MRYGKLKVQAGGFWNELRATTPGYQQSYEGRQLYDQAQDQIYYGCDATDVQSWIPLFDAAHDMHPITGDTYDIGSPTGRFNEIHAVEVNADNLIGDLTGDVAGNLVGDVLASDGLNQVLENGTDGTDSWYRGNIRASNGATVVLNNGTDGSDGRLRASVTAQDTNTILSAAADRANSWLLVGNIKSADATNCLVPGATSSAATFAGTSTKAKYA